MHLRESDDTVRYAEPANTVSHMSGDEHASKTIAGRHQQDSSMKEVVEISTRKDCNRDEVLKAIFATWVLLLHRYQRDSTDQLEWRIQEQDEVHCLDTISVEHLETVADLLQETKKLRVEQAILKGNDTSSLVLRDRSGDDVSQAVPRRIIELIHFYSGHLRYNLNFDIIQSTQDQDGNRHKCHSGSRCLSYAPLTTCCA